MKKTIFLLSIIIFIFSCEKIETPYTIIEGCKDEASLNFNALATVDTCCYISGCMNSLATNYDESACIDTAQGGSCIFINIPETWNCETQGCVDPGDGTGEFSSQEECYNANACDTTTFSSLQKILIEDFTGHTCPNCPQAATQLDFIKNMFPEQIVGVAIHGEHDFSRPYPAAANKFDYDFRTTWGKEIDDFFGAASNGLPIGMINRVDYSSNHLKTKDQWLNEVQNMIGNTSKFGIKIYNHTPNAEDPIIIVKTKVFEGALGNYNIVVCLTEDNIINWQKDGTTEIENYEHNHILRSVLNSSWGESLKASQTYIEDEIITKTYSIEFSNLQQINIAASNNTLAHGNGNAGGWNLNNINVVVYIYDTSNWEIIQIEEMHLTP